VRRTQLYLDDDVWNALHVRARRERTTISELVRRAVRDRYAGSDEKRREAMLRFVGSARRSPGAPDSVELVRSLRKGRRIERIGAK
jgi:hypothetical protein